MLTTSRKPFPIGGSKAVTLPQGMIPDEVEEVSIAASNQLVLIETTGKILENKLLEFFLKYVEPNFNPWWEEQKRQEEQDKMEKRVEISIPKSLWDEVYLISGSDYYKASKDTYGKVQANFIEGAIRRYLNEIEEKIKKYESDIANNTSKSIS